MREIFTSGSSRGEWVAPLAESPSLLLYRYVPEDSRGSPMMRPQVTTSNDVLPGRIQGV